MGDTPEAKGLECSWANRDRVHRLVLALSSLCGDTPTTKPTNIDDFDGDTPVSGAETLNVRRSHPRGRDTERGINPLQSVSTIHRLIERDIVGWCLCYHL